MVYSWFFNVSAPPPSDAPLGPSNPCNTLTVLATWAPLPLKNLLFFNVFAPSSSDAPLGPSNPCNTLTVLATFRPGAPLSSLEGFPEDPPGVAWAARGPPLGLAGALQSLREAAWEFPRALPGVF